MAVVMVVHGRGYSHSSGVIEAYNNIVGYNHVTSPCNV